MAPYLAVDDYTPTEITITVDSMTSSQELRSQWTRPGDVFSVLLIRGGDVVNRSLNLQVVN